MGSGAGIGKPHEATGSKQPRAVADSNRQPQTAIGGPTHEKLKLFINFELNSGSWVSHPDPYF